MPAVCSVCSHPSVELIDGELSQGSKSRRVLAIQWQISLSAIGRHVEHRRRAAGALLSQVAPRSPSTGAEEAIHRRVDAVLSGAALIREITHLRQRADRLSAQAEASKDIRTALQGIRELTRLLELQGRLALEAQHGRASDVSTHPVWLSIASEIMSSLAPYPDAALAVAARIRERLGVDVPVTVQTQVVPSVTEGLPFPD